ncbi:YesL family protein [Ornithinibacillus halotolerans]|uniref:DUF624 domain-containing protein n=1 Tax=Ornithinibacillus halotolerans TaxID=1274357 RepID=A0A916S1U1_9BACI|nr:DUF624 domain-containing protein [Ornithinibacillus halotolerans]GGA79458.1 hypothetical protein GCM10008025_23580 [Ornithinibacillus halotolerans]
MNIATRIFGAFEWFMRLVRLNIVFLLGCIGGLFIFSFFPSIVATFAVAKAWIKGEADLPIRKVFWENFKENYARSMVVGYLFCAASFILYIDFKFFNQFEIAAVKVPAMIVLIFLVAALVMTALYIFSNIYTMKGSLKELIKSSFFTSIAFPHWTAINLIGVVAILFIGYRFPGTVFFLTFSSAILWIACMNQIVRNKLEQKIAEMKEIMN